MRYEVEERKEVEKGKGRELEGRGKKGVWTLVGQKGDRGVFWLADLTSSPNWGLTLHPSMIPARERAPESFGMIAETRSRAETWMTEDSRAEIIEIADAARAIAEIREYLERTEEEITFFARA